MVRKTRKVIIFFFNLLFLGSILFRAKTENDLIEILVGDPPTCFGIPAIPARSIAQWVFEIKEECKRIF